MTFRIPDSEGADSPWPIFERLLNSHDELSELSDMLGQDVKLAFMMRAGEWGRHGRQTLGTCYCQPSAQGDLRPLFEQLLEDTLGFYPDFLIVLSDDWWAEATPVEREVLVFHEALHAGQARDKYGELRFHRETGVPIPTVRPHDLEEFNAVVARYGAWKGDVAAFLSAARTGEASKADVF